MKKHAIIGLSLALVLAAFTACAKGPSIPVAGSAKPVDMLTLIPKSSQGVIVVDVHRALTTAVVDKAIKDNKDYQEYKAMIDAVGLDPQKDIYFAGIGLAQVSGKSEPDAVVVINLKYDKDKIVAKIKEKSPDFKEDLYEGVSLFSIPEKAKNEPVPETKEGETEPEKKEGEPVFGAFLNPSNIALGQEAQVKSAVDILKGKAESAAKNAEIMKLVKTANKAAMVWSVFTFGPDQIKQMTAGNPFLTSLESLKAVSLFIDYKNATLDLEIKAMTTDAAKNKDMADFLNGLKALGSMAGGEKPEIGQLLNAITVSSAPDHVKIAATLPEELMNKLSAEAQKQVEAKLSGETAPEKKDETKKEEVKK